MRKVARLEDLERQGYVYKLTRPWLPLDPMNVTEVVLAESSPGVSG